MNWSIPVIGITSKILPADDTDRLYGRVYEVIEKSAHTKQDLFESLSRLVNIVMVKNEGEDK